MVLAPRPRQEALLLPVLSLTRFVVQGFVQDSLAALVLLHLHQQLRQVVAQEVLLLRLQGGFVVVYGLRTATVGLTLASV